MNFIRGRAVNSRLFKAFCDDLGKEHQYLLFHTEVRWLLREKVLSGVAELVTEVAVFLREHESVELATLVDDNRFQLKVFYLVDVFRMSLVILCRGKQILDRGCREGLRLQKKVISVEKESKKPEFCYVFTVGQ